MPTTVISTTASYGAMTNQTISRLIGLNASLERLSDAIATASSDYEGVPGTQFETSTTLGTAPNLFGVSPSAEPGEAGTSYAYAMGRLHEEWEKFWALAEPFIEQLDNGSTSF